MGILIPGFTRARVARVSPAPLLMLVHESIHLLDSLRLPLCDRLMLSHESIHLADVPCLLGRQGISVVIRTDGTMDVMGRRGISVVEVLMQNIVSTSGSDSSGNCSSTSGSSSNSTWRRCVGHLRHIVHKHVPRYAVINYLLVINHHLHREGAVVMHVDDLSAVGDEDNFATNKLDQLEVVVVVMLSIVVMPVHLCALVAMLMRYVLVARVLLLMVDRSMFLRVRGAMRVIVMMSVMVWVRVATRVCRVGDGRRRGSGSIGWR